MATTFLYSLFFTCFISILSVHFFIKKYLKSSNKIVQHPPSPPSLPIIGHLHLLSLPMQKSFQTLASRYGPLMRISLGTSTSVIVSNAAVAKEVFKTHDLNFAFKPEFGSSEYNMYQKFSFFGAGYGTYWRFMKKICMTKLLSLPQLNLSVDIRRQEIMKLLEVFVRCSEDGEACDVGALLTTLMNNIICRMTMSTRCSGNDSESKKIREFSNGIGELGAKLIVGDVFGPLKKFDLFGYGRRLQAWLTLFDKLVEGIMVKHEEEKHGHGDDGSGDRKIMDMMDILLEICKDENVEVKITRNHIKSLFLEIFQAGTETTSVALQWTLAEIINHPDVFKKLRDEINMVVGSHRLVEESDIQNLPYLQALVKESLRLHPSLPLILRKCKEDCKINGYDVLANSRVMINVYAIMRDPDSWEHPMEFLPDRFVESSIENHNQHKMDIKSQNFHFLPFGGGRRSCPGAALASTVMHGTIGALIQCFDWKVKGGEKVNMEEGSGVSGGMSHSLVCYPITHFNPLEIIT